MAIQSISHHEPIISPSIILPLHQWQSYIAVPLTVRNALLNTNLVGGKRWNTVESKANLIYLSDLPLMPRGRTDRAKPFRENQPMESSAGFCMNGQDRRRTWRPEWAAEGARVRLWKRGPALSRAPVHPSLSVCSVVTMSHHTPSLHWAGQMSALL